MLVYLWKRAVMAGLAALALAGCATDKPDGPVFATADAVAAAKPDEFAYKHAIRVNPLEGLDETIQRNLTTVLRADDFTKSLRQSLANDQMLAPEGLEAEFALTPVFVDLRTAPVSDGVTAAQAIFDYRIVRTEDKTVVFNRRIKADFSSVADADFSKGGLFGRTLRFVGIGKPETSPLAATHPDREETRAAGPGNDAKREIHAARNAIALNIRQAMRHMIVSSPERITFDMETEGGNVPGQATPEPQGLPEALAEDQIEAEVGNEPGAETGDAPGAEAGYEPGAEAGYEPGAEAGDAPGAEAGYEPGAEAEDEEEPQTEDDITVGPDGKPLPPLAPDVNEPEQ